MAKRRRRVSVIGITTIKNKTLGIILTLEIIYEETIYKNSGMNPQQVSVTKYTRYESISTSKMND